METSTPEEFEKHINLKGGPYSHIIEEEEDSKHNI